MSVYGLLKRYEARAEKKRIAKIQRKRANLGKIYAIETIFRISEEITGRPFYYGISILDDKKIHAIQEELKKEMISYFERQHELIDDTYCPTNDTLGELNKAVNDLGLLDKTYNYGHSKYTEMKELLKMVEKCQQVLDDRQKLT